MVNSQSIPASEPAQDPLPCDFAQISTEKRQIRRLMVSYRPYIVRGPDGRDVSIPLLRLQGAWLERAGFSVGTPVKVQVGRGRLIIEAAELERVSKAELLERIAQVSDSGLPKREFDALLRSVKRSQVD